MNADSKSLSKNELKEILNKNWMTHDAMWFYNCLQEFGIEKTNKINKAAVRDMAAIEINESKRPLVLGRLIPLMSLKAFLILQWKLLPASL